MKRLLILLSLITVFACTDKAPESLNKTSWVYEGAKLTFADSTFQWAALTDTASGTYTYLQPTAVITINDIIFTCKIENNEMSVGGNLFMKE